MFDFKGDLKMKTLRKLPVTVGAIVVVVMMAATANAGCGDIGHG
jgi:tryptophanase